MSTTGGMAPAAQARDLRELRAEVPEDLPGFEETERQELARRWRIFAPIVLVMIVAGEIAPFFSPEFPPNLVLSATEFVVVGGVYLLALMRASRGALELATVLAGTWSGVYAGVTAADSGGFKSVHLLGMVLVISLLPAIFSLSLRASLGAIGGSLGMFVASCAFKLRLQDQALNGLETSLFYIATLATFTVVSVDRGRRLRYREYLAQRIAERLHRFAVEEVMCRHLPPRYVERVLAGEHPLNAPPERRVITVLFADVVGFTPLSERLQPEQLGSFMARFYDVTAQAAFQQGATIDKFIGDAVMAILGAPDPMDARDQARRAMLLATQWHERVAELSTEPGAPQLHLRIGIHQDVVAVGAFGGRHRSDYTVLGRGVNLAARLEQRCRPGEILISEALHQQLDSPSAALVEVGLLELKGIPEKQRCFALPVRPARSTAQVA